MGSINRFVAGCEIDNMTSSEIAFAIFIAKHNLPMAVGDEFGLLAKKMWCSTTVPVAHPGGEKNTKVPLFTLFRPACPAFSFVDVDTYATWITLHYIPAMYNSNTPLFLLYKKTSSSTSKK